MELQEHIVIRDIHENTGAARFRSFKVTFDFVDMGVDLLLVGQTDRGLCWISFCDTKKKGLADLKARFPKAVLQRGPVHFISHMDGVDLDLYGTPFQIQVWKVLLKIKRGETTTYHDVARKVGKPKAARAVGSAIGANPISVLIPCHRVIRSDGGVGGYAWGIDLKKRILLSESS